MGQSTESNSELAPIELNGCISFPSSLCSYRVLSHPRELGQDGDSDGGGSLGRGMEEFMLVISSCSPE
jgi:hypothetical protein